MRGEEFYELYQVIYQDVVRRSMSSGKFNYNNVHADLKMVNNEIWFSRILKKIFHKPINKIMYISVYIDNIIPVMEVNDYTDICKANQKMLEEILSYIFDFNAKEKLEEYNYDFHCHNFKTNDDVAAFYNKVIIPELLMQQLKSSI